MFKKYVVEHKIYSLLLDIQYKCCTFAAELEQTSFDSRANIVLQPFYELVLINK